jgi:hypothetical protein
MYVSKPAYSFVPLGHCRLALSKVATSPAQPCLIEIGEVRLDLAALRPDHLDCRLDLPVPN